MKPPDLQQQQEQAQADKMFKEAEWRIEMDSLWEQAEAARDETEKEKRRRAMEEFYRLKEENATLGSQLEENLTVEIVEKQDWSKIIRDIQNSRRHQVFYQGSSRDHQWNKLLKFE